MEKKNHFKIMDNLFWKIFIVTLLIIYSVVFFFFFFCEFTSVFEILTYKLTFSFMYNFLKPLFFSLFLEYKYTFAHFQQKIKEVVFKYL